MPLGSRKAEEDDDEDTNDVKVALKFMTKKKFHVASLCLSHFAILID